MSNITCPCKKCILFPICKTKVDTKKIYHYETQTEKYFRYMDSDVKYYYMLRFIYEYMSKTCRLMSNYIFIEDRPYKETYKKLREIYYVER